MKLKLAKEFVDFIRENVHLGCILSVEQLITKDIFDEFMTYLRSCNEYQETIHEERLIITQANTEIIISNLPNISKYCYSNCFQGISENNIKVYTINAKDTRDLPDDLSFKMSCKNVAKTLVSTANDTVSVSDSSMKSFAIEKIYEYRKKDHGSYFLKIVKTGTNESMLESDVTSALPTFQIEWNVLNVDTTSVIGVILEMIQNITGIRKIISKAQQESVLADYMTLIKKVYQTDKFYFLAPKPVNLEKHNVVEPSSESYGIISVLQNYAVTDKADGERMLLYIDKSGYAFFINNIGEISYAGMRCSKYHDSLLDGEFVRYTKRIDDQMRDIYAVFDVYFINGQSILDKPLISGRAEEARNVCDTRLWTIEDWIEIKCKEHFAADGIEMRNICGKLLANASKLPYEIDGLIFTPRDLSVFGYYPGVPVKVGEKARWDRVFKWKPPEQNTIDFLVKLEPQQIHDTQTKEWYVPVKLYTGYNAQQTTPISVMQGIQLRYNRTLYKQWKDSGNVYNAELFQPISYYENGIETAWVNTQMQCQDGSTITDNCIVEFGYNNDPDLKIHKRWVPLRVRDDKTRILQKTGTISKTANDLSVANSVWRSIHEPVTYSLLTKVDPDANIKLPLSLEERLLGTDDVYYARDIPRQHMLSVHMLNFHNHSIKKMLYMYSKNKDSLLELACGMAGDLPRWYDAKYRFVLGLDLVQDNIVNPKCGAYSRMLQQRRAIKDFGANGIEELFYPDIVFAVGDCGLPFNSPEFTKDEESLKLLRVLYSTAVTKYEPWAKYIIGKATRQFSVVSCQFALHYFFKNEQTLTNFLTNVSSNLKKGGIFITTFMDASRVTELLESGNGVVEGKKLNDKIPVWALIKRYGNLESPYGNIVDVFLENTNRLIPEYLVDFTFLTQKATEFGLQLEQTALFSDNFYKELEQGRKSRLYDDLQKLNRDPIQRQFSFLNRWAIFRKV